MADSPDSSVSSVSSRSSVSSNTARTTTVVLTRWRRYGHDRVYVRVDDIDVGFRDLRSGEVTCTDAELADLVARETARFVRPDVDLREPRAVPTDPSPSRPAHRPQLRPPLRSRSHVDSTILLADRDLAANEPGSAARAQAEQLKAAAPIYSLVGRLLGMKTDERNWRIGADAEAEVGRRLGRLGPQWRVLHAVPIGERGSDIDHVVIGPGGVFTINTKHHPDASVWVRNDTVRINGQNQPYVRNSRFEANRAAKLLSAKALLDVDVHALVVVMGAPGGFTVKAQPADGRVTVVPRKRLAAHLVGLPVVLGEPSIDRIYSVARHLATWQPTTVRWDDF